MPKAVKITGRSSSITNSFVNGIIPTIPPTEKELEEVLALLGMTEGVRCAYCGGESTEWDHFRPLVRNKKPTGYISEIQNLVPACGKCNQSKGNKYWREWILSDARLSPKTRAVEHLDVLVNQLEKYESWSRPTIVDFEKVVGSKVWEEHWENCERIHRLMKESQQLSDYIKVAVAKDVADDKLNDELLEKVNARD
ncbi:HNH endonuclease [Terribacillus saccharophilus]|uniref:HNH endonuclease n=2 Tax=Terribacillus saccharophilus TaxID=361277 RepID=A0ABX4GYL0_9BACI|nr:HNH endonuclease [Terribacillus saccharophilus]PAD96390.1 HNH endonuclease [Terribacillus saccharophilus]PAD99965.1 HNH endonuclease [Terribacillus saccharophilus]